MNVAVEVGIDAVTVTLRVTSVRSRGHSGGAIFAGKTEGGSAYVVVASHLLIPDSSLVDRGQVWSVEGSARERKLEVNGSSMRSPRMAPGSRSVTWFCTPRTTTSWDCEMGAWVALRELCSPPTPMGFVARQSSMEWSTPSPLRTSGP
jgi:hypothetical protein